MNLKIFKKNGVYFVAGVLLTSPMFEVAPVMAAALNTSSYNGSVKNETALADKINSYEKQFQQNSNFGNVSSIPRIIKKGNGVSVKFTPDKNNVGYTYTKGSIPVLISAPHAIKQPARPGANDFKLADAYTGAIVKYIAEQTGAHVIYKTAYTGVDDNYMGDGGLKASKSDTRTPYRDKIEEIIAKNDIKLVIDIHGFADSDKKDYGVVFGTNGGKNLLNNQELIDEIIQTFKENGYVKSGTIKAKEVNKHNAYYIDGEYAAGVKNRTITNYVATTLKTPAIQIELSRTNRDPKSSKYLSRSVNTIIDVINNVANLENADEFEIGRSAEIVGVSSVKLKSAATSSSSDLMTIYKGAIVAILDESNKNYVKVQYNNKIGYVPKSNITRVAQISNVPNYVFFREGPSYSSDKIAKVHLNEYVSGVEKVNENFAKINYGGTTGYVPLKFLSSVNEKTMKKDKISDIEYMNEKTISGVSKYANLRSGATIESDRIATINLGEKVSVVEKEKNGSSRTKVAYKNHIGYVSTKYLK